MLIDFIPQARMVRKAGRLMTPPPAPRREPSVTARMVLTYALGLWPLTAVVLLVCGLLVMAGNSGAP